MNKEIIFIIVVIVLVALIFIGMSYSNTVKQEQINESSCEVLFEGIVERAPYDDRYVNDIRQWIASECWK